MHSNSGKPSKDSSINDLSKSNLIHLVETIVQIYTASGKYGWEIAPPEEFGKSLQHGVLCCSTH